MDALERVVRPIVEGQIRGFLKEHPSIVNAVDWYKCRPDKATTFVNSLGKRITLDLLCPLTRERIEGALFEIWESEVAPSTASDGHHAGTAAGMASNSSVALPSAAMGDQIGMGPDLVAIALRAEIEAGTYQPGWQDIAMTDAHGSQGGSGGMN